MHLKWGEEEVDPLTGGIFFKRRFLLGQCWYPPHKQLKTIPWPTKSYTEKEKYIDSVISENLRYKQIYNHPVTYNKTTFIISGVLEFSRRQGWSFCLGWNCLCTGSQKIIQAIFNVRVAMFLFKKITQPSIVCTKMVYDGNG